MNMFINHNNVTIRANFWWDWGLNSGLHAYKACAPRLEIDFQSILLWLLFL
jgi:hypothetical protein